MHGTNLHNLIKDVCTHLLQRPVAVDSINSIGGGSINRAYKVEAGSDSFFIKINDADFAEAMFKAEQNGLSCLAENSSFFIPKVYGDCSKEGNCFLMMEFIKSKARSQLYWQELGEKLAGLHRNSSQYFGYDVNNFIGSLPQPNNFHSTWSDFFITERIQPMLSLAEQQHLIDLSFMKRFIAALPKMMNLIPVEPPGLLHGDLWSGNLMVDGNGSPTIIDPAVYYGHREMDLAFTHLFGGFTHEFYEAYHHYYPLERGFDDRIDIHNLYPLLVHLNLFGRSYLSQIESVVRRFT